MATILCTLALLATTISTTHWGDVWERNGMTEEVPSAFTPGSDDFTNRRLAVPAYYAFFDGWDARAYITTGVSHTNILAATRRFAYLDWDAAHPAYDGYGFYPYLHLLNIMRYGYFCGTYISEGIVGMRCTWSNHDLIDTITNSCHGITEFDWTRDPSGYIFDSDSRTGWLASFNDLKNSAAFPLVFNRNSSCNPFTYLLYNDDIGAEAQTTDVRRGPFWDHIFDNVYGYYAKPFNFTLDSFLNSCFTNNTVITTTNAYVCTIVTNADDTVTNICRFTVVPITNDFTYTVLTNKTHRFDAQRFAAAARVLSACDTTCTESDLAFHLPCFSGQGITKFSGRGTMSCLLKWDGTQLRFDPSVPIVASIGTTTMTTNYVTEGRITDTLSTPKYRIGTVSHSAAAAAVSSTISGMNETIVANINEDPYLSYALSTVFEEKGWPSSVWFRVLTFLNESSDTIAFYVWQESTSGFVHVTDYAFSSEPAEINSFVFNCSANFTYGFTRPDPIVLIDAVPAYPAHDYFESGDSIYFASFFYKEGMMTDNVDDYQPSFGGGFWTDDWYPVDDYGYKSMIYNYTAPTNTAMFSEQLYDVVTALDEKCKYEIGTEFLTDPSSYMNVDESIARRYFNGMTNCTAYFSYGEGGESSYHVYRNASGQYYIMDGYGNVTNAISIGSRTLNINITGTAPSPAPVFPAKRTCATWLGIFEMLKWDFPQFKMNRSNRAQ